MASSGTFRGIQEDDKDTNLPCATISGMDLSSGLFALGGATIGLVAGEVRHRQEWRERHRDITFEKRLQAHQDAFYWTYKLPAASRRNAAAFTTETHEATEFWRRNCLFLDRESKRSFELMLADARSIATLHGEAKFKASIQRARTAIVNGVGHDYLPERATDDDQS